MWQKPILEVPNCFACGTPMKLIPAGVSKKTGNPYEAFWSCPNNLKGCEGKTIRYTESTPQASQKPYNKPTEADIPVVKENSDIGIIQLNNLASRIDMAVESLGRVETKFNEISEKLDSLNKDIQIIINEIVPSHV